MLKVIIDHCEVEVPPGATILAAAQALGVEIPTLCYRGDCRPSASCLVCVVRVNHQNRFVPACATPAGSGMRVESETPAVHAARKAALELLLSDHRGECLAPCRSACPAHLDIQLMLSQIAGGQLQEAARTAKEGLVLPAVLGHICSAPCQKACRRAAVDRAIAIRDLHRDLTPNPFPEREGEFSPPSLIGKGLGVRSPKRVAIIGAGPAGLAAAYHLLRQGIACTLFDQQPQAGGGLRYGVPENKLPHAVLDAELAGISALGAEFRFGVCVGETLPLANLRDQFDAVLLATGESQPEIAAGWGLATGPHGIVVERRTFAAQTPGLFAAGGVIGPHRLAVRSIGEGAAAAAAIAQYLAGVPVTGLPRPFTIRAGNLKPVSLTTPPTPPFQGGAQAEASLCLQCGCQRAGACKLRYYTEKYGAHTNRYTGSVRPMEAAVKDAGFAFDEGKCIACGLCAQLAEGAQAPLGLAFSGRGFPLKVTVPFDAPLGQGLGKAARACVEACPTSALYTVESPAQFLNDIEKRRNSQDA